MIQFECPRHPIPSASLWLGEFHILIFPGEKRKWALGHEIQELAKFQNKVGLKGCKWSSLNAPGTQSPLHHSGRDNLIFSFFLGNKGNGLWGMKVKSWKNSRTKLA